MIGIAYQYDLHTYTIHYEKTSKVWKH